jgi:hypothetical protein
MISYSTNWMGPVNLDWIEKNGNDWAGGRIDVYGNDDYYPDELSLPIMKAKNYGPFSEWIRKVRTVEVLSLKELVERYENETGDKIIWWNYETE